MVNVGIVHGSKESAVPIYVGLTTVYERSNIKQVEDNNGNIQYEYEEVQYGKDEYIMELAKRIEELTKRVETLEVL